MSMARFSTTSGNREFEGRTTKIGNGLIRCIIIGGFMFTYYINEDTQPANAFLSYFHHVTDDF